MSRFKPGDRVRCVDVSNPLWNEEDALELDRVYTVAQTHLSSVRLTAPAGFGYWPRRFELVESPPTKVAVTLELDVAYVLEFGVHDALQEQVDAALEQVQRAVLG